MSRTKLDQLGKRLAASEQVSDDDLDALLEVLSAYSEAMAEAQLRLRDAGYEPTTRLKTTGVLVDKLRRQHSGLKGVQDIAGARIVAEGSRNRQDDIVQDVVGLFVHEARAPRVKDRRAQPSSGYRAVHVVVTVLDLPVEVQVRTERQDTWAQIVESLGDKWGRGIRYGQGPPKPYQVVSGSITRADFWRAVIYLGDTLDSLEIVEQIVERRELLRAQRQGFGGSDPDEQDIAEGAAQEDDLAELKVQLARAEQSARQKLELLAQVARSLPD